MKTVMFHDNKQVTPCGYKCYNDMPLEIRDEQGNVLEWESIDGKLHIYIPAHADNVTRVNEEI